MSNYVGLSLVSSDDGSGCLPGDYVSDPYAYLNTNLVTPFPGIPRRALFRPFGSIPKICFLKKQDGTALGAGERYVYPACDSQLRDDLPTSFFTGLYRWVQSRISAGDSIVVYIGCPAIQDSFLWRTFGSEWWTLGDPNYIKNASWKYRKSGLYVCYDDVSISSTSENSPATALLNAEAYSPSYGGVFIEPTVRQQWQSSVTRGGVLNFGSSYSRWIAGESDITPYPPGPLPKFGSVGTLNFCFITGADSGTEPGRLALCDAMRTLGFNHRGTYNDIIAVTGLTTSPTGPGWTVLP
jgi:hypothetical protein